MSARKTSRPKARLGIYVPPEAAVIEKTVSARKFPDSVAGNEYSLSFGTDSTGDAAVWIKFPVINDPELPKNKEKVAELVKFSSEVTRAVIDLQQPYWPYVDFETVSG